MGMGEETKIFVTEPVEMEYRGKKLLFYPFCHADNLKFLDYWMGKPVTDILGDGRGKLIEFICKSLRVDQKTLDPTLLSDGFLLQALYNILQANDFDFFVAGSDGINKMVSLMAKTLGLSFEAQENSPEQPDGPSTTSSGDSQPSK